MDFLRNATRKARTGSNLLASETEVLEPTSESEQYDLDLKFLCLKES
jgi:hypothetical protein